MNKLDEVVTVQEAADIKKISVRAIRQQCEQGKLKCRKAKGTWLILKSSL